MPESRTLLLQRALSTLILDGDETALAADPGRAARRHGLSPADQGAFRRQGEALLTYRELARLSLVEPLEDMFPVLRALLEGAGAWEGCVQAFLEARQIRSGHYRDIAPAFLGWLAETAWGQARWPFLLELAHGEVLEVLVARFPDAEPRPGLSLEPTLGDSLVLDPATQVVSYTHAIHRVSEASPIPEARPTHLLAYRDPQGEPRLRELTPVTAALLVRAQQEALGPVAGALGLNDLDALLHLMRDLQREGAIAGFQPPT